MLNSLDVRAAVSLALGLIGGSLAALGFVAFFSSSTPSGEQTTGSDTHPAIAHAQQVSLEARSRATALKQLVSRAELACARYRECQLTAILTFKNSKRADATAARSEALDLLAQLEEISPTLIDESRALLVELDQHYVNAEESFFCENRLAASGSLNSVESLSDELMATLDKLRDKIAVELDERLSALQQSSTQ